MLKLFIGNKNYSSWSMRPWVLMTHAGIPFEEVLVRFDSFAPDSQFKTTLRGLSPAGKVPLLLDGELAVWDTLAIAEYLAEQFPDKALWPRAAAAPAASTSAGRLRALRQAPATARGPLSPLLASVGKRPTAGKCQLLLLLLLLLFLLINAARLCRCDHPRPRQKRALTFHSDGAAPARSSTLRACWPWQRKRGRKRRRPPRH